MKGRFDSDDWGRDVIVHQESADHVKGVMEACKERVSNGMTGGRDMRHLAEFPGYIIQQYCDINGITWAEWFQNPVHCQRMLQDPDLAYFRIDATRVAQRGE